MTPSVTRRYLFPDAVPQALVVERWYPGRRCLYRFIPGGVIRTAFDAAGWCLEIRWHPIAPRNWPRIQAALDRA